MDFDDPKNTKSYSDALKVDPNSIITTSIDAVPVTVERKPYQPGVDKPRLAHAGVARANLAATHERPEGTTENDWAQRHQDQTVRTVHTLTPSVLMFPRFCSSIAISLIRITME